MEEFDIESRLVEEIRAGNKFIEARLGKPEFLKIKEGDVVSIRENLWLRNQVIDSFSDAIRIKITQILYFETFHEMLHAIDHRGAIPTAKTIEDALEVYKNLYSQADENEFGVIAFYFDLILT